MKGVKPKATVTINCQMNPSGVIGVLFILVGSLMTIEQSIFTSNSTITDIALGVLITVTGVSFLIQSIQDPPVEQYSVPIYIIILSLLIAVILFSVQMLFYIL